MSPPIYVPSLRIEFVMHVQLMLMTCFLEHFQIASRKHQIDEQGWVDTILSVPINGTVRINTMDWLGQSQFSQTVVFWPVLLDAISKVQILICPPYRTLQWCIPSSDFHGILLQHQLES